MSPMLAPSRRTHFEIAAPKRRSARAAAIAFGWHTGIMIDNGGMLGGDGRDAFGARRQTLFQAPKGSPQREDPGRSAGRGNCIVAGRALMDVLTNTSRQRR